MAANGALENQSGRQCQRNRNSKPTECIPWAWVCSQLKCNDDQVKPMPVPIPSTTNRKLKFDHGEAIGMSQRWQKGQYCSILTTAGIVGCGIYDLKTAAEFDLAIAIAKGTPARPLVEPEDLFDSKIVGVTPRAASFGIQIGMTGKEAVERMLQAK